MNSEDFKRRTKAYALRVVRLVNTLPPERGTEIMGKQLLRCATSVGANYRAACRARSLADFAAKLCIVEEEADESLYWMELLVESGVVSQSKLEDLLEEGNEIVAMVVSSIKTARAKLLMSNGKHTNTIKEATPEYAAEWLSNDDNIQSNNNSAI